MGLVVRDGVCVCEVGGEYFAVTISSSVKTCGDSVCTYRHSVSHLCTRHCRGALLHCHLDAYYLRVSVRVCVCECVWEIYSIYVWDRELVYVTVLGPALMCFIPILSFNVYTVNSSSELMFPFFFKLIDLFCLHFFAQCYSMCEGQILVLNVHINLWSNQWLSYFIRSVVVNCMHYTNQLHGDIILRSQKNKDHIFCTKKLKFFLIIITVTRYSWPSQCAPQCTRNFYLYQFLLHWNGFFCLVGFFGWKCVFRMCKMTFIPLNRSKKVSDVHCSFPK